MKAQPVERRERNEKGEACHGRHEEYSVRHGLATLKRWPFALAKKCRVHSVNRGAACETHDEKHGK
jgi:hypothetical protein